jgi:transcriptional regulator with XRE-family HTH domain
MRERRRAHGLSQEELAARIRSAGGKVTQTGIAMREKRSDSRPRFLEQIAEVLNVTPYWLKSGRAASDDAQIVAAQAAAAGELMAALKRAALAFAEVQFGTAPNSNEHRIAAAAEADARKIIAYANKAMK